jgi:alpha-tubulin suppressor-like RCC1 family protein
VSGDRVEPERDDVAHLVRTTGQPTTLVWPTGWPHSGTSSHRTNLKCGFSAMFYTRTRAVQLLLLSHLGWCSQPPSPVTPIGSLVQSQERQHRRMRAHTSVCRPGTACRLDIHGGFSSHHLLIQLLIQNLTSQTSFPAVRLAAGGAHSMGVLTNGTVWSWGSNALGQLGDGTTVLSRTVPVPATGLSGVFVAVAGGVAHSLALRDDGRVFAWGLNSDGQLGDGTTTLRRQPVQVSGLTGVVATAAGAAHSLALKDDGTVVAWGANLFGQVGDNTNTRRLTPVNVSGLSTAVGIAAGGFHSLGVLSSGDVRAWGANLRGQLGDGTLTNRKTPVTVSGVTGAAAVAGGGGHSLVLTSGGAIKAWGDNTFGQLGDGTTTLRKTPITVATITSATTIAAGGVHSLATLASGAGRAWGGNDAGQLGDGTTSRRLTPVAIAQPPSGIDALAAGTGHSLAQGADNSAWSWGLNLFGQLGDGSTARSLVPVPIGESKAAKRMAWTVGQ